MQADATERAAVRAEAAVRSLTADRAADWDAFVERCADATFFHLSGWRTVLERAFGHRTHFLYAERDGRITGVLPLVRTRSVLFGDALSSLAFCVYGGAAAEDDASRLALEKAAVALAERLGVDYLELRNRTRRREGWPTKDLYVTFRKPIDPDPEQNMLAIPRKQRAMVRKGIQAGLRSRHDEGIDDFYRIYAESVRNLGTPVFSRRYFQTLVDVFGDCCEILTVTEPDGTPVSSVMSFYFRNEVLPYYGGGTPRARQVKGFDFLYWELMRRACEHGIRLFDYGRSKLGTGSYSFKKNWGFEPEPLPYQYHLVRAREMPDVNPSNPKYKAFIAMWKRLPLPLANAAGPLLSRSLG